MRTTWSPGAGTRRRAATIVAAWLLLLCGSSVLAGEDQEDLFIKHGIERRRLDDDAGALELFIKAYELHHAPRALAQIGLARMALGLWVQAEADLEGALAATDDAWIRKNTGVLYQALEKVLEHVGRLEVLGTPVGAEVVVGGEVRGALPMDKPIRLTAGEYHL